MTRAAFRAYQVERCVGRWRKCIASDAMAIVRSHDDTAGGEMSFTAALGLPVVRAFSPTTTRHWRTWFQTMRWILFMAMNPHSWQSYDCFYLSQRRQVVTHCHKVCPLATLEGRKKTALLAQAHAAFYGSRNSFRYQECYTHSIKME